MNKKMEAKRGRVAGEPEAPPQDPNEPPNLKLNVLPTEDALVIGEQMREGYADTKASTEDGAMLFMQENDIAGEEEYQRTNLDALLAVWWKYKRENKQKRKKRKMLKIYRDENYWNDGRYTDDEDFNHYKS